MLRTIEATIDKSGRIKLREDVSLRGKKRALVTILDDEWIDAEVSNEAALFAEAALSKDWLNPEEDKAWEHLKNLPDSGLEAQWVQMDLYEAEMSDNGAADDEEEELDVRCLEVPIFKNSGECTAALSFTGTVSQIGAENSKCLVSIITRAGNEIGKNLWSF